MAEIPYDFYYEVIGKGNIPLVMLHGFGESSESLRSLAGLISETRHVLLIDLPGFGKTPFNESLISAEEMAKALHSFLKRSGFQQSDILGHSFGGKVAMIFSSLYPEHVRKLILIASSGLKRKRGIQKGLYLALIRLLGKCVKGIDKTFNKDFFSTWFIPQFGSDDYQRFPHVRKILVRSVNENVNNNIRSIKAPALLLWGALDQETPLEMGYRLQRMIKRSSIVVYPTLGHKPFKDVGCHLVKEHVVRFLDGSFQ